MGSLDSLHTLALDLRRSSSSFADELWSQVDPDLWMLTRNPWIILQTLTEERKEELEKDGDFVKLLKKHADQREKSLAESVWFQENYGQSPLKTIAYFSMEFGLSESLPIYSGGLGLLAGDHLKACSDLGVPLVGIGILYQQGYFRQSINTEGQQIALYPYNEPSQLPITPVKNNGGTLLRLAIEIPGRTLFLRVYKTVVGKIPLYLLDSNDLLNTPADRALTSELYGGDHETRLMQEVILGIGGTLLLQTLGIDADVYHLNEGHAAFAILERTRALMHTHGLSFQEAFDRTKKGTLFTTHTPVEAGFDRFPIELMRLGFREYAENLGIPIEDLLSLGQLTPKDPFNMAYLAVRGSSYINGVSKLHGEVSRKLFAPLFPGEEVPVGHVTNGVHIPSWESPEADLLWCHCSGEHRWYGTLDTLEKEIKAIPNEELWDFRCKSRQKLISYTRRRMYLQLKRNGASSALLKFVDQVLDPNVLTIGFSRRFATYKRVDLLLTDPERLKKLLHNEKHPVQLILAGKAHPKDKEGQALVEKWIRFIREPEVRTHAVFLSDYDILVAERLVQGMDLWINTPRRPWEASGTSGMKLLVNGGLNLSELDGWWVEAYSKDVGWALGDGQEHDDTSKWDKEEAEHLYTLLEKEVVPLFYDRGDDGIPHRWLDKVKESMARLTPAFSTNRMVREYVEKYYLHAAENFHKEQTL